MKNFLITLCFGWLGVHRFMQKKYLTGAIWLCTLGLCGIGWIIDTLIAFKQMQNKKQPKDNCDFSRETLHDIKASKALWQKWQVWLVVLLILGAIGSLVPEGSKDNKEPEKQAEIIATQEPQIQETREPEVIATELAEVKDNTEIQTHIYDNAITKDVLNSFGTEKIGEYSVIEMDSSEVTQEILEDWYFNYVNKNDFKWNVILYTDKENKGVYASSGLVSKDVIFEVDAHGDYNVSDFSNCITYMPHEGNTLKRKKTKKHRKNRYGISYKNIEDTTSNFMCANVINDVTGNWRISVIAEAINIEEYALSFYKKYFDSNEEIHAIVNFTYNTTTCIQTFGGSEILYVTIHEYVKGEEHDAKLLFSGMELTSYKIYTDNGDIIKY